MYARVLCRECWDDRRKRGLANRKKGFMGPHNRKAGVRDSARLLPLYREVFNEDPKKAKELLREVRDKNPPKFFDSWNKAETKAQEDTGPQVVVVYLPRKVDIGAPCAQPEASTKDAVERLVMDLEDRKGV